MDIRDTRTIVKTTVEQNGKFYSATFKNAEGTVIEKVKNEQQFIEAVEFLNHLNLGVEVEHFTIDVS